MATMVTSELEAFLTEPRHAVVATNRAGKAPQLSPVWYVYESGVMIISTSNHTAKYRNLANDAHISVCVDGGRGDARYVVIEGVAEIVPNGEPYQLEMRRRIIWHYHESEASARAYHDSTADSSQVLIVVRPEKVISHNFN
jgi:PPOX class probable F420-dependent enzyme